MSDDLTIKKDEYGVTRVFAVNLGPENAVDWANPGGARDRMVEDALGAHGLDHDHIDVIETDAIRDLGLATYLTDGIGLPEETVRADAAKLNSLSGFVLVVGSAAFRGEEGDLDPGPSLTHIATYRTEAQVPSFDKLTSDSARGEATGTPLTTPETGALPSGTRWITLIVGAILAVILLLFLFNG